MNYVPGDCNLQPQILLKNDRLHCIPLGLPDDPHKGAAVPVVSPDTDNEYPFRSSSYMK
jgi:hypothetical protein